MNEQNLLKLLSQLTKQLVFHFEAEGRIQDKDEFSDRLTEVVWDSLISMVRDSLASEQMVLIDEIGVFAKTEDGWRFDPSATMVESYSLSLDERKGSEEMANQALFYLKQTVEILRQLPGDMNVAIKELPHSGEIAEFENEPQKLSSILLAEITRLLMVVRQLAGDRRRGGGQSGYQSHDVTESPFSHERVSILHDRLPRYLVTEKRNHEQNPKIQSKETEPLDEPNNPFNILK